MTIYDEGTDISVYPLVEGYEHIPSRGQPYSLIGKGGSGVVFKVRDSQKKIVALKWLDPDLRDVGDYLARFHRECNELEKARGLNHPVIVQWLNTTWTTDGANRVLVSEYVQGQTIADYLAGLTHKMTWQQSLWIVFPLAHALERMHSQKIGHRDLSLNNLLVPEGYSFPEDYTEEWEKLTEFFETPQRMGDELLIVRLIDFGLARDECDLQLTQYTATIGTANYRAPEFDRIRRSDSPNAFRADMYSFGAILFACLTGNSPRVYIAKSVPYRLQFLFRNRNKVSYGSHLKEHHPNIHIAAIELIDRCLESTPGRRPTAKEAVEQLQRLIFDSRLGASDFRLPSIPILRRARAFYVEQPSEVLFALILMTLCCFSLFLGYQLSRERIFATIVNEKNSKLSEANAQLMEAVVEEQKARKDAQAAKEESVRGQIAQLLVSSEAAIAGNATFTVLPYLLEARRLDPQHQPVHDQRIGSLLAYSPKLQNCFVLTGVHSLQWNERKQVFFLANSDRVEVRTATGRPVQILDLEQLLGQELLDKAMLSADGRHVVGLTSNKNLFVWDFDSGTGSRILDGDAHSFDISRDGRHFAWGSGKKVEIRSFDIMLTESERLDHPLDVLCVKFAPDSQILAAGVGSTIEPGGGVVLWDVQTRKQVNSQPMPHRNDVLHLEFCHRGDCLYAGDWEGGVTHWHSRTGKSISSKLYNQTGMITNIAFCPNAHTVGICSAEGTVRIHDAERGTFHDLRHVSEVTSLAFMSRELVLTGGFDRHVKLWNLRDKLRVECDFPMSDQVKLLAASLDGNVACADLQGLVKLWKIGSQLPAKTARLVHTKQVDQLATSGQFLAYDTQSSRLVGSSGPSLNLEQSTSSVWWLDSESMKITRIDPVVNESVEKMFVSSSGKFVAIGLRSGECSIFTSVNDVSPILVHEYLVGLADPELLVTLSDEQTIRVRRLDGNLDSIRELDAQVATAACRKNRLFTVGHNGMLKWWNLDSGMLEGQFDLAPLEFSDASVAISAQADRIAIGQKNGEILSFDTQSQSVQRLAKHSERITCLAFSTSGNLLASGSRDRTAILWNCARSTPVHLFQHRDQVNSIAFSPNDQFFAVSEGSDLQGPWGSARVYDVVWGGPITPELIHGNDVYDICFHPKLPELWTTSWDGLIRCWALPKLDTANADYLGQLCISHSGASIRNGQIVQANPREIEQNWLRFSGESQDSLAVLSLPDLMTYSNCLIDFKNKDGRELVLKEAMKRLSKTAEPTEIDSLLWTIAMAPCSTLNATELGWLVKKADVLLKDSSLSHPGRFDVYAAVLYRAQKFQTVVEVLSTLAAQSEGKLDAYATPYMAMAQKKLGNLTEAKRWFEQVRDYQVPTASPHHQRQLERLKAECLSVFAE